MALRAWQREDVPALVAACADPLTARYTSVPVPYTPEDAAQVGDAGRAPTPRPRAAVRSQAPAAVRGAGGLHAGSQARRRGEI
ncbi:MAG: GNAT family N-acetyltransferase, partial [Solirubrobacterales bacterium]